MFKLEELTLELTDWCPLRCQHCSSCSDINCGHLLEEELTMQLVNQAATLGAKKISFGGGEPTSAKTFIPAIRKVIKLGLSAEVFTCGVGINSRDLTELPDRIGDNLVASKEVKFIFSIHGATPEVHDSITETRGSFEIMLRSLRNFIKLGIKCEFNFVPLKTNIHQFEDVVSFSEDLGIKKLSVLRFVPQGRGYYSRNNLELSNDEENLFITNLLFIKDKRKVEIRTGSPFNGIILNNNVPCRAGFAKLVIQADGNVLPCEVFKHNDRCRWGFSVYNRSLSEILSSKVVLDLYKSISLHNCLKCPVHGNMREEQIKVVNYALS